MLIEQLGGFFYFSRRSGKDALFGSIAISQHELQPGTFEKGFDLIERCGYCQHRTAVTFTCGHQYATQA